MISTLEKQPNETKILIMPFNKKMSKSETITAINSVTVYPAGPIIEENTINVQKVNLLVSGGVNRKIYKITVEVTTSLNQILENEGYLAIEEI